MKAEIILSMSEEDQKLLSSVMPDLKAVTSTKERKTSKFEIKII